jgi:hypothetical protein
MGGRPDGRIGRDAQRSPEPAFTIGHVGLRVEHAVTALQGDLLPRREAAALDAGFTARQHHRRGRADTALEVDVGLAEYLCAGGTGRKQQGQAEHGRARETGRDDCHGALPHRSMHALGVRVG